MSCTKTAGIVVTAKWLKDGQPLLPSHRITFSEDNKTVSIGPVEGTDNGQYQCQLSNPMSTGTAFYNLIVNYGPEDVIILGERNVQVGSALLLYCSATSLPAATFTWTVNQIETVVNTSMYVIEKSNYTDSGIYNCKAWNAETGLSASVVQIIAINEEIGVLNCPSLTPGEAVGVAVGVIAGVGVLALAVYFGIKHSGICSNERTSSNGNPKKSISSQAMTKKSQRLGMPEDSGMYEDCDPDSAPFQNRQTDGRILATRYAADPTASEATVYENVDARNPAPRLPPRTAARPNPARHN